MEERKGRLNTLVKRLFIIDAKLNGETAELVSEYNMIVEEIYSIIYEYDNKPKQLILKGDNK